MDKITVLGGHGFLGSWFCNTFVDDVIRNDKHDTESYTNNLLSFVSTTDNYNVLDNPFVDVETNISFLLRLLDDCKRKYGKDFTFNYISTWFVYGRVDISPVHETVLCDPTGFYSITKRAAEQLLISYCETFGIKWRIIRLGNVLGVGDKKASTKKNALQHMVRELVQGRTIKLYKGRFLRDFIDVRDAIRGIKLVMDKGELNTIYNVGNGVGYAINELIQYVAEQTGADNFIELVDVPDFHKLVQVESMYLDITKLISLGYEPQYSILDTLDWLIQHYKNEQR